jgi:NhaC family Na+:H+ antiporter
MGLSVEITAGAIISGAYFGDKMSPMSDTTNLAPAVADSELFAHIRHMVWTTTSSIIIALIGFLFLGLNNDSSGNASNLTTSMSLLEALDSLLSRGGMSSMVNTVWLILCAMTFGGVMENRIT